MDKLSILERFAFYQQAPAPEQVRLAQATAAVHLPAGGFFYREGDRCPSFALVGRGEIRVFKTSVTGREITLYHVQVLPPARLLPKPGATLPIPAPASPIQMRIPFGAMIPP